MWFWLGLFGDYFGFVFCVYLVVEFGVFLVLRIIYCVLGFEYFSV